jgi:hypothetical protein
VNAAQDPLRALGICLEEYEYPYPVRFLSLGNDLQQVAMAYMDIPPGGGPNGQTVVGAEDHTVPLGQYAQPAEAARLGDFTALSAAAARDIPRATRVVIPDCGHIPHLEHPSQFLAELLPFLAS